MSQALKQFDVGISTSLVNTIILRNFDIIQEEHFRQTTKTFASATMDFKEYI